MADTKSPTEPALARQKRKAKLNPEPDSFQTREQQQLVSASQQSQPTYLLYCNYSPLQKEPTGEDWVKLQGPPKSTEEPIHGLDLQLVNGHLVRSSCLYSGTDEQQAADWNDRRTLNFVLGHIDAEVRIIPNGRRTKAKYSRARYCQTKAYHEEPDAEECELAVNSTEEQNEIWAKVCAHPATKLLTQDGQYAPLREWYRQHHASSSSPAPSSIPDMHTSYTSTASDKPSIPSQSSMLGNTYTTTEDADLEHLWTGFDELPQDWNMQQELKVAARWEEGAKAVDRALQQTPCQRSNDIVRLLYLWCWKLLVSQR